MNSHWTTNVAPPRSPYLPPLCACPETHPAYPASDVLCCTRDKFAVAGFGNISFPVTPIKSGEFRQLLPLSTTATAPLTSVGVTSISVNMPPVNYSPVPAVDLGAFSTLPETNKRLGITLAVGALLFLGALGYRYGKSS